MPRGMHWRVQSGGGIKLAVLGFQVSSRIRQAGLSAARLESIATSARALSSSIRTLLSLIYGPQSRLARPWAAQSSPATAQTRDLTPLGGQSAMREPSARTMWARALAVVEWQCLAGASLAVCTQAIVVHGNGRAWCCARDCSCLEACTGAYKAVVASNWLS